MSDFLSPVAAVVGAAPAVVSAPITLALLSGLGLLIAVYGATMLRQPTLVAERLGVFGPAPRNLEEMELQASFRQRVLRPLIRGCARMVLRYTPASKLDGLRRKLTLAGNPGGLEVRDLLGIQGLVLIGLPGAYVFVAGLFQSAPSVLVALALAGVGFRLPGFVLARKIGKRQNAIQRALPDTLDLLTICVEAGLGFDAAIARVVDKHDDELSREFGRVMTEMRMGRSRRDALRAIVDRTDVGDLNTFVSAIVQSEQLGVSISKVLLTQSAQMRLRRRQRAEELAHKAPIKMLFPMVFLIFPAIFVVILGPALPEILRTLN